MDSFLKFITPKTPQPIAYTPQIDEDFRRKRALSIFSTFLNKNHGNIYETLANYSFLIMNFAIFFRRFKKE